MSYDHVLSDDEKRELLRIARATLREFLAVGRIPPGAPHKKTLLAPAGVFVTLSEGESLRGCIGTTAAAQPVYKAVQEMAVAAASRDPRFPSVRAEELNLLTIEISVLGARRHIAGPEDIEIGRDGLTIAKGSRRGLLLPQVAVEHGWDAEQFLARTCEKANLGPQDWRSPDATVDAFTAQVFDEKTLKVGPHAPPGR
ncbi:MAG TPA: AmmeMemoRadiSam system protein A [Haliangiales bacterium]|nr:AmmeMemoRadiSam system protein A [Haliangiales bacterium]